MGREGDFDGGAVAQCALSEQADEAVSWKTEDDRLSDTPFFSIIMPVYRVERYLEQAVRSVLQQTFADFELLLVDDCSPDGSGALADRLAQEDGRIRVLHKAQNEGPGYARNTGVDASRGEWISFMDADDWLDGEMLAQLAKEIKAAPADIIVFGFSCEVEQKDGTYVAAAPVIPQRERFAGHQAVARGVVRLDAQRVFQYPWNKVYRAAFVKTFGFRFEEIRLSEDAFFNLSAFSKADCVQAVEAALYHYRKPLHQTLASAPNDQFFALCNRRYTEILALLQEAGVTSEEALQAARDIHTKQLLFAMTRNAAPAAGLSFGQQRAKIKQMLHDETTRQMLRESHPASAALKGVRFLFWHRLYFLCAVAAKIVAKMQAGSSKMLQKLKKVSSV